MKRRAPRVDINRILRHEALPHPRGAPMGARSYCDDSDARLYVQRVRFIDGDYAPDGTYWGAPADLWCAFDLEGTARLYVRAPNRTAAIAALLKDWAFNVKRVRT